MIKKEISATTNQLYKSEIMEFDLNNEKFIFFLSYNNDIIIFNLNPMNSSSQIYELYLTLQQLYKINKIFLSFDSINEVINWIYNSYKEKNCLLKSSNGKYFIQLLNPLKKTFIEIGLISKEKDLKSRIDNLEKIVFDLSDNKIKELNKKINFLEEKIKKLELSLEVKNINFFQKSHILKKDDEQLILDWIPNKLKNVELLFNSDIDGDSLDTFLKKSNGKCSTLVVIQTKKGIIFGGYTSKPWKEEKISDENAFVFSLITRKKYSIKDPSSAIGLSSLKESYGSLMFGLGNNAIVLYKECTSHSENYVGDGTYNISEPYELNGGERNFTVKSYELFHLQY